ncbi:uncharacterized protein K452DRAFT_295692 [Aplosporella prunicola CBS 121167]|uniref:Uncharacterized protein n=1 Tax=Aplosporella prunicola CBS 121167 TaxID=1176127 RepID=A0A6A6BM14_9PEZI|nr:uncharacterized protein K452DRAFT_295692 [Aplosporella prunicola CBS 121167]KAF2145152.1 hypothetical protein K452DRAFT_295692 [Aplosporella prunicola CBS 121167]
MTPRTNSLTARAMINSIFDTCNRTIGPVSPPSRPRSDDNDNMSKRFLRIAQECILQEVKLLKQRVNAVHNTVGTSADSLEETVAMWPALPDADSLVAAMKQALHFSRSMANIFIAKKHVGGNSDFQGKKGELP